MLSSDMIASTGTKPFVLAENIAKSYGGVQALTGVSLAIAPGEVHGLVGANGAGKSTLIKVLAGLVQPDGGRVLVDGVPVSLPTPHHATDLGMSFIHQERSPSASASRRRSSPA
jgi:ABC-type sugar transport system ATPase subunit